MNNNIINYPAPKQEYKVLVKCFTYNQSKYIEEALNGFAMQQTNFPFVCLVMDDASTDGEQEVIRAWMERECDINKAEIIDIPTSIVIIVPHKTNTSCTFAFYLLKYNLYGTGDRKMNHVYPWREKCVYEALCEGDDYWIDSLKLQEQVDFLDENPEYVLVHSDFIALNDSTGHRVSNASSRYKIYNGNVFNYLFEGCFIRTPTVCFRKVDYELHYNDLPANTFNGDLFLFYNLAAKGKFYFFEKEMCVYRVLQESASHTTSEQKRKKIWQRYKNLDYFIAKHFKVDASVMQKLDYKWFKMDLRNYIATNSFKELNDLILPGNNISFIYKFLYYSCKVKVILSVLSSLLRFKNRLGFNKWF